MFSEGKSDDGEGMLAKAGFAIAEKTAPNKSICPSLSLKTRVYGWLICLLFGYLVAFASSSSLLKAVTSPIRFAILYSLGTTITLCSSLFLWGPKSQCKSMFQPTRRISIIIVLVCIAGVITCACLNSLAVEKGFDRMWVIILLLVLTQSIFYFWYSLSFIPYGRTIFCKCCKKCVNE